MSEHVRFAIYVRYSSEIQSDKSLEEQEFVCRQEIARRDGMVVEVYRDDAKSGWSLDRPGFNTLRMDAEKGKFDAIMFWKFDRLARDHSHALMIKILLRHEYGVKLFCVEGYSEDDDDSPHTAMMEQMVAVFSAFYSRNLSTDTKRGKKQRVLQGEFNGSIAPLGYDLVTRAQASPERPAGLHISKAQAEIVRDAFERYATGKYSDVEISQWMNQQSLIQQIRAGRKPVDKEFVREMLQNRTYTGRVGHADTQYIETLGTGRRASRGRREWFEGKHEGFIDDELFERCREVRKKAVKQRASVPIAHNYLFAGIIYCSHCLRAKPAGIRDKNYGRLYTFFDGGRFYRCKARIRGYAECDQPRVPEILLEKQVADLLTNLSLPEAFKGKVESQVQKRIDEATASKRITEILNLVEKIDFGTDTLYANSEDYLQKQKQLEHEVKTLPDASIRKLDARDLLYNFRLYRDKCSQGLNPQEMLEELFSYLIEQVIVFDFEVVSVTLYGGFVLETGIKKVSI